MTIIRRALPLVTVLAVALAAPAQGLAKSPPLGKYNCFVNNAGGIFGDGGFTLKKGGKYTAEERQKGTWKAKGKKIYWKSGPLKKTYTTGTIQPPKGNDGWTIYVKTVTDSGIKHSCYYEDD